MSRCATTRVVTTREIDVDELRRLDPSIDALPAGMAAVVAELGDGTQVLLRPLLPSDRERVLDGFGRMSAESRYRRFFSDVQRLPSNVLDHLLDLDHHDRVAWAALDLADRCRGIGVARYVRVHDDPIAAEAAVAVIDDYHHRGVGTLLLEQLAATALRHGIRRFVAPVLADNTAVLTLAQSIGARRALSEPGVVRVEIDLPDEEAEVHEWAVYRLLRAFARDAQV